MKVIYLGIDMLYPVLDSIIDQGCNVMKLFSCPTDNVTEFNTRVLKTADKYNIPYTLNKITETDLIEFKEAGCDLLVCAGYYYRVPILETLPMVNFHPSPLPLGRGPWPMPIILLNGLPYGGFIPGNRPAAYKFCTAIPRLVNAFIPIKSSQNTVCLFNTHLRVHCPVRLSRARPVLSLSLYIGLVH